MLLVLEDAMSHMDGFGKIDNCKCLRRGGGDGGPGDGSGEFEDNDNLGLFKLHVVAGDNGDNT